MKYEFSVIIPVYNRPQEVRELLESCLLVNEINACEILIVEDGSSQSCKKIVEEYQDRLHISYYFKPNSGPGDSRNYGMKKAKASYYIILDSDVLLPKNYITNIKSNLKHQYVDCFGGRDQAGDDFSAVQKAINYSMTSFLTTGGVRGKNTNSDNFQPRSFNMGLSEQAFIKSDGFSNIHPGEDPDLSLRLKQLGFSIALFPNCFVYHKRRVNWKSFSKQMFKFGLVRPILNSWHPKDHKMVYYLPSLFTIGFVIALLSLLVNFYIPLYVYILYFILVFSDSLLKNKNLKIAVYSIYATCIQFFSYGFAYLKSTMAIFVLGYSPEKKYPELFFKNKS